MATRQNFALLQGDTFERVVRWESRSPVYKAISNIAQEAPARITASGHGIPDGWRAAVVSVKGMTQINAKGSPPRASDLKPVEVVDASTVKIPDVNAAGFRAYTSGGYLFYYAPVSLAGYTARMTIRTKLGGTQLVQLTTENGGITIDDTAKTITLLIEADDSAAFDWKKGVYDLELVSPAGVVTKVLQGSISVTQEIST